MSASGMAAVVVAAAALAVSAAAAVQLSRLSATVEALEGRAKAGTGEKAVASAGASAAERDALKQELEALREELKRLRGAPEPVPGGEQGSARWEEAVAAVLEKKDLEERERSAAKYGSTRMGEAAKEIRQLNEGLRIAGDQATQVEDLLRAAWHRQGAAMTARMEPEAFREELDRIRTETVAAVRLLLTPEQAEKFDRLDKSWMPGPVANKPPRR
jgi:DNA repair exonuclease SbcCD ATPase subunit